MIPLAAEQPLGQDWAISEKVYTFKPLYASSFLL